MLTASLDPSSGNKTNFTGEVTFGKVYYYDTALVMPLALVRLTNHRDMVIAGTAIRTYS